MPSPRRRRRLNQDGILEGFANLIQIDFDINMFDDDYDYYDDDSEFDMDSDYSDLSMLELLDGYFFDAVNI